MELLDFKLPQWTRVIWINQKAREIWQPRINAVVAARDQIERLSVVEGVRKAARQAMAPEKLPELVAWATERGLTVVPLGTTRSSNGYAAQAERPRPGEPFVYSVVIARPRAAAAMMQAHQDEDDDRIGQLLGYPKCCRTFFGEVWGRQIDTTWQAGMNTPGAEHRTAEDISSRLAGTPGKRFSETVKLSGPPEANVLLRWIGVRAVSHLPHSFSCERTVAVGKTMIEVGRAHGYDREMDWLLEMLSWPAEWSALHGIAVIVTPVLKISATTDATAWKYVVQRDGTSYPEEGAKGLVFPFKLPKRPRVTSKKAFEESVEAAVNSPPPKKPLVAAPPDEPPVKSRGLDAPGEWYWVENGFTSADAMDKAHRLVVEAVLLALGSAPDARVLDLGAGNGALLKRIIEHRPGVVGYLAEINRQTVDHARKLGFLNTWQGDLFDYPFPAAAYAVTLLMPGRLIERPEKAREFVDKLRAASRRVVLYAYGDWLKRYGDLQGLMQAAGLQGKVRWGLQNDVAGAVVVEEIEHAGFAES